jgi:hypothetical protein
VAPVLDALEAARLALAPACRRLQWGDLASVPWITPAFRERVRQEFEACGGDPRQWLARFRQISGMREDKKQACEEWLGEQGYLIPPPPRHQVVELARNKVPVAWPDRLKISDDIAGIFEGYAQTDPATVAPSGG